MKANTDLEQSKKLAEILPIESADQTWVRIAIDGVNLDVSEELQYMHNGDMPIHYYRGVSIPCWSLAALLCVLPTLDGRNAILCKDIRCNKWHVCYHSTATLSIIDTERYDNPVDACYEMINRLSKNGLI